MIFIDQVMKELWKEEAVEFRTCYEAAMNETADQLYRTLKKEKIECFGQGFKYLNILPTCGCSYHFRNLKNMSGCSMCNLHTNISRVAKLKALRDKDAAIYAQAITENFTRVRGQITQRTIAEQIITHNFFDTYELPPELLDNLFGKNGVFQKKPLIFELETNVNSICLENVKRIKKYCKGSQIWVRIGIECNSEWLRNHWLNKNTSNYRIKEALRILHEEGCKITANLLMGIPGVTEEQSLQDFKEALIWLNETVDMYNISLLNLRKNTLQYMINQRLADKPALEEAGIAQGNHTSLPWLFTLLRGIRWALINIKGFDTKLLAIGQFFADQFEDFYELPYNYRKSCSCKNEVYQCLRQCVVDKKWNRLVDLEKKLIYDPCYEKYLQVLYKQNNSLTIKHIIGMVGEEIARIIWPDSYEAPIDQLKKEIENW